jgi:hypothetical protein
MECDDSKISLIENAKLLCCVNVGDRGDRVGRFRRDRTSQLHSMRETCTI